MTLMDIIESGGSCSVGELAERLKTSPEMIEAKLERYEQLGIVKKSFFTGGCGGKCKNCGKSKTCGKNPGGAVMSYWEKVK
ncbi:MAG: FeoC-like transcriptional regulator [Ruminococcus sp.]|nr:FeoC-like transcriptional regulator [Ruminococcus sp.]